MNEDICCPALPGNRINARSSSCIDRLRSAKVPRECKNCNVATYLIAKYSIGAKTIPRICKCGEPCGDGIKSCLPCHRQKQKESRDRFNAARRENRRIKRDAEELAGLEV